MKLFIIFITIIFTSYLKYVTKLTKGVFVQVEERTLKSKPLSDPTPHDKLMNEVKNGTNLVKSPKPKVFTIKDMFEGDPSLLRKLNILPGQRRKNFKVILKFVYTLFLNL